MSLFARVARMWIPLAVGLTLLSGLVYVTGQQVLRMSADDPQIQIARDAAYRLSQGATPESVVGSDSVDVANELGTFVVVFDSSGAPIAGSGQLHGELAAPPKGVLDHARSSGEDRVTWQPQTGVRVASITESVDGDQKGFVFVGRSLKVAEEHIDTLGQLVTAGWLAIMVGTLVVVLGVELVAGTRG